jgi:hypothetical protein
MRMMKRRRSEEGVWNLGVHIDRDWYKSSREEPSFLTHQIR